LLSRLFKDLLTDNLDACGHVHQLWEVFMIAHYADGIICFLHLLHCNYRSWYSKMPNKVGEMPLTMRDAELKENDDHRG